jgi:hypothetical protein
MMGGVAFILLKAASRRPQSRKQAEIRLAELLKILSIRRFPGRKFLAESPRYMRWLHCMEFPDDMANSPGNASFVI